MGWEWSRAELRPARPETHGLSPLYLQVYKATGEEFVKIAGGECVPSSSLLPLVFDPCPTSLPTLAFLLPCVPGVAGYLEGHE